MDLYRITAVEQLARLQLADSWRTAVSLVEWPERLGSYLPAEHLSVTLLPTEEVCLSLLSTQMHCTRSGQTIMTSAKLVWQSQADRQSESFTEDTDAADDLYTDKQRRHIMLQPFGERWEAELSALHAALVSGSDTSGTRTPR